MNCYLLRDLCAAELISPASAAASIVHRQRIAFCRVWQNGTESDLSPVRQRNWSLARRQHQSLAPTNDKTPHHLGGRNLQYSLAHSRRPVARQIAGPLYGDN